MTSTDDVTAAAQAWAAAGAAVVPTRTDGTKAPLGTWKQYQTRLPTADELHHWYSNGQRQHGVGVVCGAISGNLEMLELEGRAVDGGQLDQLMQLVRAAGLEPLWQRITTGGYVEWTPSGGMHILYRVTGGDVPGNTKLARAADGNVLAETRGEGGYVVVAPSHGPVHPTGQAWTVVHGTAGHVPTITAGERADLHRVVRFLDQQPPAPDPTPANPFTAPARPAPRPGHVSPGDDFEARVDWSDPLLLADWTLVYSHGGRQHWRRPGKKVGVSATTGGAADGRDRLYVFTTSTCFDAETPYTKFGAYTQLHYGGDHTAAAAELRRLGYGTQPEPTPPPTLSALSTPPAGEAGQTAAAVDEASKPMIDRLRAALLDSRGLDSIPEPDPIIDGALYRDSTNWLSGAPGNGKSFVALDMAGCVGCGETWHGFRTIPGKVLYLIAEGATGIRQRVRAWEKAMGKEMSGVHFLPVAVQSSSETDWTAFIQLAAEVKPALIVIDTQARVTVGLEENSARDMGQFVHRVEQLRVATGACILIIHHTGRSGDHMRGSTAMEGAATTIIRVSKDDDVLEIECQKQKDAVAFDPFKLRLVSMESSAILTPTDAAPKIDGSSPAVKKMLTTWWESHESDWVSASVIIKSNVATETTFHRAKKALVRDGFLEVTGEGRSVRYRMLRPLDSHALPHTPMGVGHSHSHTPTTFKGGSDGSVSEPGVTELTFSAPDTGGRR